MKVNVEVTGSAQDQVRELLKAQPSGLSVRLFVQSGGGGGCGCGDGGCGSKASGTSFGLAFDRARGDDEVVKVDGFSLLVDPESAPFVDGAKIDFVQGLEATGFTVTRPSQDEPSAPIGSGCGCGSGGGCC